MPWQKPGWVEPEDEPGLGGGDGGDGEKFQWEDYKQQARSMWDANTKKHEPGAKGPEVAKTKARGKGEEKEDKPKKKLTKLEELA